MYSYWEKSYYFDQIDYLIIGGGIVGITTSILLKEKYPDAKILLIERGVIPKGASTKNAGFACIGSPTEILADLKNHDEDEVIHLLSQRWNGLKALLSVTGPKAIDYQNNGGYELYKKEDKDIYENVIENRKYLNQLITEATNCKDWYQMVDNKFGFDSMEKLAFNTFEGQINPMKMIQTLYKIAIQNNINILTSTNVTDLNVNNSAVTLENGMQIEAKKILICTNAFSKTLLPDLDIKPARNQVLMTKVIPGLKIKGTFHYNQGYIYFRNYKNRLLLGGARNIDAQNEQTDKFGNSTIIKESLMEYMNNTILPNQSFEIETWWSGIIAVGARKTPIVKTINDRIFVAARLSGIGVAIGSLVAKKLVKLV